MSEREEGWGCLHNARKAHYFRNGRSLCGMWSALGSPIWERNQSRGEEPDRSSATCKGCWRKAPQNAPA